MVTSVLSLRRGHPSFLPSLPPLLMSGWMDRWIMAASQQQGRTEQARTDPALGLNRHGMGEKEEEKRGEERRKKLFEQVIATQNLALEEEEDQEVFVPEETSGGIFWPTCTKKEDKCLLFTLVKRKEEEMKKEGENGRRQFAIMLTRAIFPFSLQN